MNPASHVVEEAIRWMVLLQSGHASVADYDDCLRWCEADPQHQLAWDRLGMLDQQMQHISPAMAHATLHDESKTHQRIDSMMRRRQVLKLVVLAGGSAGLLGVGYQKLPWRPILADYRTAVGENRQVALSDGSQIHLNTASALDVAFDKNIRLLRFYQGEILFTTGHAQSYAHQPFIVDTSHGRVRALGTRFVVREQEEGIQVSVFDGAVEVAAADGQHQKVSTGQSLFFTQRHIGILQAVSEDSLAWLNGVIVARNIRLEDFLRELNRYHHGYIRCAPTLAEMRISGVFPINDIDKVLSAVSDTLHVSIKRSWHYWIRITPAA